MMTLDLFQDAKGEDVAEVEIERHDNAGIGQGTIDQHLVVGTLQPQRPDVHRFGAELFQEIDGLWRDTSVGQKPHWFSGADWVDFVLGQGGRVGERLTDVFLLEGLLSF